MDPRSYLNAMKISTLKIVEVEIGLSFNACLIRAGSERRNESADWPKMRAPKNDKLGKWIPKMTS